GAEAADFARTGIEPKRPELLSVGLAANEVGGRGLSLAAAPFVERIEGDQRHERLATAKVIFLDGAARSDHPAGHRHALHRRNCLEGVARGSRPREESGKLLVLRRTGVEQ